MTLRGQDQGQEQREPGGGGGGVGRGAALAVSSEGLLEGWKAQREPSLAPGMPCHHGEALECTSTQ